jgi:hypothetical protein
MPSLGRLEELIERLAQTGRGVTIRPVEPGSHMGGDDATLRYAFEGWEVGWITAVGGDELAVGDTIESAVNSALDALE